MMCIMYIIAWLLAGTVELAPNMLALLTYKKNPSTIPYALKKNSHYWVHAYKGTEKVFLRSKLPIIFCSKLEIERYPCFFAVVLIGSNHSPHLLGKIHVN
jgi:hypothetical protein